MNSTRWRPWSTWPIGPAWRRRWGRTRVGCCHGLHKAYGSPGSRWGCCDRKRIEPGGKSQAEIFRRVVLLRLQVTPDTPGDPGVARPGIITTPAQVSATAQGSPTRKIKMSGVIDPTFDSEVVQLDQTAVTAMYAKCKSRFWDHPSWREWAKHWPAVSFGSAHQVRGNLLRGSVAVGPPWITVLEESSLQIVRPESCNGRMVQERSPRAGQHSRLGKVFQDVQSRHGLARGGGPGTSRSIHGACEEALPPVWPECWVHGEDEKDLGGQPTPRVRFCRSMARSLWNTEAVKVQDFWTREVVTPSTLLLARNRQVAVGLSLDSSIESIPERSSPKRKKSSSPKPKKSKKAKTGKDKSVWDDNAKHCSLNRKSLPNAQTTAATSATCALVHTRQGNALKTDNPNLAGVRQHLLPSSKLCCRVRTRTSPSGPEGTVGAMNSHQSGGGTKQEAPQLSSSSVPLVARTERSPLKPAARTTDRGKQRLAWALGRKARALLPFSGKSRDVALSATSTKPGGY